MSTTTTKSLFDQIYEGLDDALKLAKKPTVIKKIKRKFQSAYDSMEEQIVDATHELATARESISEDISSFSVQALIDLQSKIEDARRTQDFVKAEYKALFGKDLPVSE